MIKKITLSIIILLSTIQLPAQQSVIENNESFIYKIDNDGNSYTATCTYTIKEFSGIKRYYYDYSDKYCAWEVTTDFNGLPQNIVFRKDKNRVTLKFNKTGAVKMTGLWDGKNLMETGKFSANVTLENALVLRTMDLRKGKKHVFDLLQTEKFPDLEAYEMCFEVIGIETVTVPAGTFQCKKVLFTVNDLRSAFFKAWYYVTDDNHRYIIKMENMPRGGSTVLTQIIAPE